MDKIESDNKLKEAEDAESAGDFFRASFFYKEALKISRNLGDSGKIKLCKKKVIEMNKKSQEQFKKVSFETKIPSEVIQKIIDSFLKDKNLPGILKKIGIHPFLYPKYEEVKQTSEGSMPIGLQIASLSAISENGHLIKGGEDGHFSWLMKIYAFNQDMIIKLYLKKIFNELIQKKLLNEEDLILYFTGSKIVPERNLKIIKVGINRYFKDDFVSALHIFIPQFESLFLFLSEKLGIDIVALNQTKEISTQTKTLSDWHLGSKEFQDIWGKDFCEQLKFILFEPLGYKLRHKVAHGEITAEECNFETATLILYLFLALIARVKIKSNK